MPEADAENDGRRIGEQLRSAREAQDISLEQASKTTKISRHYLIALENGDFAALSSPAYVKGFLKLYATYLGLSAEEVVAQYEATVPKPPPAPVADADKQPPLEMVERVKFRGYGRWIFPALLLCLVVLAARFFSDMQERRERPMLPQQVPAPATAPPVAAVPQSPAPSVQPQRSSARQAQPAGAPQTPPAAGPQPVQAVSTPVQQGGGVMLRLRCNRDTWLDMTIDNSVSQHYDLKTGDVIEWKGERLFSVDVGDGAAVEAEFNGRPLKSLGEAGKAVHVELKGVGE